MKVSTKHYKLSFKKIKNLFEILAMDNIPEVTPHKKRRKFTLTCAISVKVIIQVWKSKRVF